MWVVTGFLGLIIYKPPCKSYFFCFAIFTEKIGFEWGLEVKKGPKSSIFSMSCMELIFFKELIFNDLLGSSNFEIVFIKFFMPLIEFASSKIGKALFF